MKPRPCLLFILFCICAFSQAEPLTDEQKTLQIKVARSCLTVILEQVKLAGEEANFAEQWLENAKFGTTLTHLRHQEVWVLETDFIIFRSLRGEWPESLRLKGPAFEAVHAAVDSSRVPLTPAQALSAVIDIESRLLPRRTMHDYKMKAALGRVEPALWIHAMQKCPHTGLPVQRAERVFHVDVKTGLVDSMKDGTQPDVPDLGEARITEEEALQKVNDWLVEYRTQTVDRKTSISLLVTDFLLDRKKENGELGPWTLERKWRLIWWVELRYKIPLHDSLYMSWVRQMVIDAQSGELLSTGD